MAFSFIVSVFSFFKIKKKIFNKNTWHWIQDPPQSRIILYEDTYFNYICQDSYPKQCKILRFCWTSFGVATIQVTIITILYHVSCISMSQWCSFFLFSFFFLVIAENTLHLLPLLEWILFESECSTYFIYSLGPLIRTMTSLK